MWKSILSFFRPPVFADDEDGTRKARYVSIIAFVFLLLLLLYEVGFRLIRDYFRGFGAQDVVFITLIAAILGVWPLMRRGYVTPISIALVSLIWIATNGTAAGGFGVKDTSYIINLSTIVIAGLLIGWRAAALVAIASVASGFALAFGEQNGAITPPAYPLTSFAQDFAFVLGLQSVLIYLLISGLENAIQRARENLKQLNALNLDLQQSRSGLLERTAELEIARQHSEARAQTLQAISEISRTISREQNLDILLPLITRLISEKFNYYHIGVFLADENRRFAALQAANTEGGRRMLSRGHRLQFGQGIVGYVAATGTPRVSLDVGADAVFFNNPDLPNTRSEMALPLRVSDEVIGVLDAQSIESNAFKEEDVEVFSTLADQVAIAIQNARSHATTQQFLVEAQRATGSYLQDSWKTLHSQHKSLGYSVSGNVLKPLDTPVDITRFSKTGAGGESPIKNGEKAKLAVPIRFAGGIVGAVRVQLPEEHEWEANEIEIVQAVSNRLSLALESATLLEATQQRAETERLTADITGRIGSTTQFDSILRTAAEELSRALGGSDVLVQIQAALEAPAEA